jgi:hypothetical protein
MLTCFGTFIQEFFSLLSFSFFRFVFNEDSEHLKPDLMIKLFEEFNSNEGKFLYLQAIVNVTDDPEVVFKYIEAAAKSGQVKEVERVVREKNYDPVRVRDFLMVSNENPSFLCPFFSLVLLKVFTESLFKCNVCCRRHDFQIKDPSLKCAIDLDSWIRSHTSSIATE